LRTPQLRANVAPVSLTKHKHSYRGIIMKIIAFACAALALGLTAQTATAGFKTRNAIRAFGNAGCVYDDVEDVPLSTRENRRVQQIVREERDNGCRG
jgi:hypothetical protein